MANDTFRTGLTKPNQSALWPRWVAANAISEMLGLGATFAVTALALTQLTGGGAAVALTAYALEVGAGAIEATLVGLAQWWAMRPWFPQITRKTWWLGTLGGALAAYVLGFLPSTIMGLMEDSAQAQGQAAAMQEPPMVVVLLLAAGMGLVAGAMLSFAQWLVLRKSVRGAGTWIPANMLAWMLGMPLVFWGIDAAQKGQPLYQSILIMVGVLLAMGAVVGAVHGWFLTRIAEKNPPQS